MDEEVLVIGVDGGATKTSSVVMTASGRVLGRGIAPPSNIHSVGRDAAASALRQAIDSALADARRPYEAVDAICLCLAGVARPRDREVIQEIVREIYPFPRVLIHNDALGALAAGTGRAEGVVVIAGTGTIAYGIDARGRTARAAGWGALLADYGSGFWIGWQALQAVVCAVDGRGPSTQLVDDILGHLKLKGPDDLIAWTYDQPLEWGRFAALAPLVTGAAEGGDSVAAEILRQAGEHLAASALAVVRRLELTARPFDLVLAGSVWKAGRWVEGPMQARVRAEAPYVQFIHPSRSPAEGAAMLALQEVVRG